MNPRHLLPLGLCLVAGAARPQAGTEPAPAPAPQKVEITGGRQADADERRQSTAAKIVIGREEIDRMGDSTVGEVLKRLPGVTLQGPPGRGGPPRMRGLGAGYTQLLVDGQRVPPGFALESLTPEQIERIEILRAPTAETGARAIGGTINIITREGYRRRLNDLRLGFAVENGQVTPGAFWTHNDSADRLTYNLSASVFNNHRESASRTRTTDEDLATGVLAKDQLETSVGRDRRLGLNATSRLQWRLGEGASLMLMPVVFHNQSEGRRDYVLNQALGNEPPLYATASNDSSGRFTVGRLNGQWRTPLGDAARLELSGGSAVSRDLSNSKRHEFDEAGALTRTRLDDTNRHERSGTLNAKVSSLLDDDHSLVVGAELETQRRTETRTTLENGVPQLLEFGDDTNARSLRTAVYAQDEWNVSPNWAVHGGLRWEGIRTRGDAGDGIRPTNRSRVVTPLLHAVWKPDPRVRDQVRIGLTRSYKSPTLASLVARPSLALRYPPGNEPQPRTSPDRAGNPDLRPELATGLDVAFERYLRDGGVISANLFYRRIRDYIRNVTALEEVSWSPNSLRYVSRPQNIGRARTQGLELEAKFRLDQLFDGAAPVEVRSNLSLFHSRVESVPGPDNRLDQQPKGTLNLGADYRFRSLPLTIGGSLNLTPGYRTQLDSDEAVEFGTKRQFDVYALWVFNPSTQLRLLASNLSPNDYWNARAADTELFRERQHTISETYVNWQLRLELKL